ncbi:alpha/beta hydrolase [soil metagenome]
MASQQSDALADLYRDWGQRIAKDPGMPLESFRAIFDEWPTVTAEPDGVHFREDVVADLPVIWCEPDGADEKRLLICFHGGGYVTSSRHTHRKMFGHVARAAQATAVIVEYGRTPENPHPGPVTDGLSAYRWALDAGYEPSRIGLVGDSAGGGLAVATALAARQAELPAPGAVYLMSAWLDLRASGESYDQNAGTDLVVSRPVMLSLAPMLLGETGDLDDPLANPIVADLSGFPPTLLQVGSHETLLDDSRVFADRARQAGADARVEVEPDMQHVFQFLAGTAPEADEAIERAGSWLQSTLQA